MEISDTFITIKHQKPLTGMCDRTFLKVILFYPLSSKTLIFYVHPKHSRTVKTQVQMQQSILRKLKYLGSKTCNVRDET